MKIESIYLNGTYLQNNPNWDIEDSFWKSKLVNYLIKKHNIFSELVCEVGCGAGHILVNLNKEFPGKRFVGFDISPQLNSFWKSIKTKNITFNLEDFPGAKKEKYDLILMLDVFEHVRDPLTFLEKIRNYSNSFIFHIPLDLSVLSILSSNTLLNSRKEVGHLTFYSKELALEILKDAGYEIVEYCYTDAYKRSKSFRSKIAFLPRFLINLFSKDLSARFFGGQTLLVYAKK